MRLENDASVNLGTFISPFSRLMAKKEPHMNLACFSPYMDFNSFTTNP